ncbi:MAG: hypothetical protein LBP21_07330 [Synergistaceae bacterium]|jgi:hypothetical protein|nr:hypothetical protein [Synergistaceae bacterium]
MIGKLIGMVVSAVALKQVSDKGLTCMFGHKWNGCTCEKCGTVRDAHHRMVSVPGDCTQQCAICGKIGETKHHYKRDLETGEYICVVCGANKHDEDREKSKDTKLILGLMLGCFGLLCLMGLWEEHKILTIFIIFMLFAGGITAVVLRYQYLRRQQDIAILNTNISKIGEDEAARRAKKYYP